ncbi:uncharacterized protein LOC121075688 [Cygnus olor]|uniref:uncharacterized protein LOC121075688 n=1 Tax=Cygnus olor TaxID=8869 RepID=UPI001ADEB31A|nr:uncharacterized protein LOC121075688 [Cygnus olor]
MGLDRGSLQLLGASHTTGSGWSVLHVPGQVCEKARLFCTLLATLFESLEEYSVLLSLAAESMSRGRERTGRRGPGGKPRTNTEGTRTDGLVLRTCTLPENLLLIHAQNVIMKHNFNMSSALKSDPTNDSMECLAFMLHRLTKQCASAETFSSNKDCAARADNSCRKSSEDQGCSCTDSRESTTRMVSFSNVVGGWHSYFHSQMKIRLN